MRILHTSDWHLGRGIHRHSLRDAQKVATQFIVQEAIARKVDLLVIAGDVYDLQRPAVEDILVLRDVLTQLHAAGIKVVMTAGNHDSGPRLAANSNLLVDGIHIAGLMSEVGSAIEFEDEHGPVLVYAMPFLEPNEAREELKNEDGPLARSHQAVVSEAMARVRADLQARNQPNARVVVVAHAFVTWSKSTADEIEAVQSESERQLAVGGVPTVNSNLFDGMHYVALGHIHGPQNINIDNPETKTIIRYSGSILRYSLSEKNHKKSFTVVDLGPDGVTTDSIEIVEIPQPRGMHTLEGTIAELTSGQHADKYTDFVEIIFTDEVPPANYYARLEDKFTHILTALPKKVQRRGQAGPILDPATRAERLSPVDMMKRFFELSKSTPPNEKMIAIMEEVYEAAEKAGQD